jgi:hypothetical protein
MAGALSLMSNCIIYLYEREKKILSTFRNSPYRYVSPNLNSQGLFEHYDPRHEAPWEDFPLFNWSAGSGAEVASQIESEFQKILLARPIFLFTGCEITKIECEKIRTERKLTLTATRPGKEPKKESSSNVIITATGFGRESNPFNIIDFSYWNSGQPHLYTPRKTPERILISGFGDSGVVELLHYVINGFSHERIVDFSPTHVYKYENGQPSSVERVNGFYLSLEQSIQSTNYHQIVYGHEGNDSISEINWFVYALFHIQYNGYALPSLARSVFNKMMTFICRELRLKSSSLTYQRMSDSNQVTSDKSFQRQLRESISKEISDLASVELERVMSGFDFRALYADTLDNKVSANFDLFVNAVTPTPFSDKLSLYNLVVVWILRELRAFKYISGRIESIAFNQSGYRVRIGNKMHSFDRVATRYGLVKTRSIDIMHCAVVAEKEILGSGGLLRQIEKRVETEQEGVYRRVSVVSEALAEGKDFVRRMMSRDGEIFLGEEKRSLAGAVKRFVEAIALVDRPFFERMWKKYLRGQEGSAVLIDMRQFSHWMESKESFRRKFRLKLD